MTADALRERIAEALVDAAHDQYPEGMRPGDNEDCGCPWGIGEIDWLGFANAVMALVAEAYEALIESIMKNADHDYWDSGSDIEAVAYVRHLEDEVERLRRVCLRRALRTWVDEFDEEADHG